MKRPKRQRRISFIENSPLGEIFNRNTIETRNIIKQMEIYGLHPVGYGIDYSKTFEQHAQEQTVSDQQLKNLLRSLNRKI